MCGIAGILELEPGATVDPQALAAMGDALAHRGPDDQGSFVEGRAGLAFRRLAIIDRAGGRQPLFNEDRSALVVFNGEIYNYRELTERLVRRGHRFATRSDTEAILHAYEDRPRDFVEELRGMFALAIWDRRRESLTLARDRLGIKPLYYHEDARRLSFASEIKGLLALPGVPREVDPEALELYLALRYVPGPRTLFRGIRKLQPGHLLIADRRGVRTHRYWDLPRPDPEPVPAAEARRRLAEALEEAVGLHLMSEVPLGVFLSGGLDSTTILALMNRAAPEARHRSYTVGYRPATEEASESNEFSFARLAAESLGAQHLELELDPADFRDALPRIAWHLDEPVADPACVPLYHVSRLARRDITVVLSGEGADEILGGYGIYRTMLGLERVHRLGGRSAAALAPALARLVPHEPLARALRASALPLAERYRGVSRAFRPALQARLLGRDPLANGDGVVSALFAERFGAFAGAPPLEQMLYVDIKTWLADDLLVKADKMTMASSQELRVPFLDHVVVELAARLPSHMKVGGGVGKRLLREAMAARVPRAILTRPKRGFPVPTTTLLRSLGGFVRETLLDPRAACVARFDRALLGRLVDEHERGRARHDAELWALLAFELWHGVFVDRRMAGAAAPRPSAVRAPAEPTGGGARLAGRQLAAGV
jgi:asparagine synthase (glutamine-hydrolysing)